MVKIDWVEIPEGEFLFGLSDKQVRALTNQMAGRIVGHPEDVLAREHPQLTVYVPTFYISRLPITQRQFTEFAGSVRPEWDYPSLHEPSWVDHPITCGWHHARMFCVWIGARLPSSFEWEKAARGTDGRLYPWGDEWDLNRGNFGQDNPRGRTEGSKTVPVGLYAESASPYGVEDMVGNGFEWTMTHILFQDPYSRKRKANRYSQLIAIRGSDPDPEALHPASHRVTHITVGNVSAGTWPPYTGFRPVMDQWQRQYWTGFRAEGDSIGKHG